MNLNMPTLASPAAPTYWRRRRQAPRISLFKRPTPPTLASPATPNHRPRRRSRIHTHRGQALERFSPPAANRRRDARSSVIASRDASRRKKSARSSAPNGSSMKRRSRASLEGARRRWRRWRRQWCRHAVVSDATTAEASNIKARHSRQWRRQRRYANIDGDASRGEANNRRSAHRERPVARASRRPRRHHCGTRRIVVFSERKCVKADGRETM